MSATTTRRDRTAPKQSGTEVGLALAIGERVYRLDLKWWTADDRHVILLHDVETGQSTRVVDLSNYGRDGEASCSCRPGLESSRCRHVRALVEVNVLPNWTLTEGE